MMNKSRAKKFYGTATLGEKGQIVIPVEARKSMALKKGHKLLVFGLGDDMISFSKLSGLEKFASVLSERLKSVREIIKKEGNK